MTTPQQPPLPSPREAADVLSTPQARVEMRLLRHPWDDRPIAEVPVESYDGLTALLQALWERREGRAMSAQDSQS